MKTKSIFYWLLLPALALALGGCKPDDNGGNNGGGNNDGGNGGNNNSNAASVTPTELVFDFEGATQSVTVTYGNDYNFYGATVDGDGQGWCTVTTPGNGKVNITVTKNDGAKRTCYVKCWVSAVENPTEEEQTILPVSVMQNAFSVEATEATFVRFNFETEAHRYHTDYGGGFDTYQMLYIWHREWDEMNVTQSNDTLTFWARDIVEHAPNGDLYYDKDFQVSIMITGFAEPYDHCEVNTVTFRETWDGRNPDPEAFWQTSTGEDKVILAHIPLVDHNISINGKTGHLYFYYEDDALNVIEAYSRSRSEALNDQECYTENYVYEGSDRDEGLVEVNFKLK